MSHESHAHLGAVDPVMARLIAAVGPYGLVPKAADAPFRHLARAITYQQLNGVAAGTIFRRLIALFEPVPAPAREPDFFPTPAQLLAMPDAALRGAGYSGSKIAALKDLAAKALDGTVPDTATLLPLDDDAIVERLTAVRGIGRWTVEMMLMFQLGRPDVLPVDDFGVRNGFRLAYGLRAMPAPKALAAWGARWAPHRSAASWYLWRACDLHKAGTLPEPLRPAPRLRVPGRRRKAVPVAKAARAAKPARVRTTTAPPRARR
jgi:DNA-3-methyladenine glycosylase II